MASIDFDPEDYLDEVSTAGLVRELKDRNESIPSGNACRGLVDDLREAFELRDAVLFERALLRIENPSALKTRENMKRKAYADYLANRGGAA